jgi:D-aspartate ligase
LRLGRHTGEEPLACVVGDLSLVRALGRDGIPVALATSEPHSNARLSRYCRQVVRTPGWVDQPEAALGAVIEWSKQQRQAPVLFYQGDHDLLAASRGRERLGKHLRCLLPPVGLVEDLVDKLRFADLAERLKLPVPLTRTLHRGKDLAAELRQWQGFPCVLKPATRSHRFGEVGRGRKAVRLESRNELEDLVAIIDRYETDFVLQAAVEGGEDRIVSYHAYIRPGGEVMGDFTGRKVRTTPRQYGFSTYVEITDDDEVRRAGRSVLEELGFSGVVKLDFKRDRRDDRLYLLEINPRFNLWHHPGAVAGVSIPALVYRDCVEPGAARHAGSARAGVRWVILRDDARASREYRAAGELSFTQWLVEMATVDVNEGFLLRDPLPGLADVGGILRRRLARLFTSRSMHATPQTP